MSTGQAQPRLMYRKVRSQAILEQLNTIAGFTNAQVYCPLHTRLFALTHVNADVVTLDSPSWLSAIQSRTGENTFSIETDGVGDLCERESFVKFSPLLDPLKHISGGYSESDLSVLPTFDASSNGHSKLARTDNSSYIDAATSAMCALLHSHSGIPNLIEFYGYFLGVKQGYRHMITDDVDVAFHSKYFSDHAGTKFKLEGSIPRRTDSLSYKPALHIGSPAQLDGVESPASNTDLFVCPPTNELEADVNGGLLLAPSEAETYLSDEDSTDYVSGTSDSGDESIIDSETSSRSASIGSNGDDEETYCRMESFPCSAIFLEKLDSTLESLTADEDLSDDEWSSALFQITITLAYLQRTINFTHNDLHTSNVMCKSTDKQWLYYKLGDTYYKVPTFGRIFKIIDFGRSVFEYQGERFASDSFQKGEDASGQYNCAPFLNPNKPQLLPNRSFDLCRLGCSLFDYFFQNVDESLEEDLSPLEKLVVRWCTDGSGKNILYRSTGEERYPGFKLYKMISRKAAQLEPERVISTEPVFAQYRTARKQAIKKQVYDLDAGPRLTHDISP